MLGVILPSDPVDTKTLRAQGVEPSINRFALFWIWNIIRPFSWRIGLIFWVPVAWALGLSLTSCAIQMIVVSISEKQDSLFIPMLFLFGIRFTLILNYRLYDYFVSIGMMPVLRKTIGTTVTSEILKKQYPYFQMNPSGALGSKINDLMRNVPNLIEALSQEFFGNTLAIIIAIVTLTYVHPIFGILMASWAMCVMGISWFSSRKLLKSSHQLFEKGAIFTGKVIDILSNILSVRLFYNAHREDAVLSHTMDDVVNQEKQMEQQYFNMRSVTSIISVLIFIANGYFLCRGYRYGDIDAGGVVLVLSVNRSVMDFLWRFDQVFSSMSEYYGSITQSLQAIYHGKSIGDDQHLPDLCVKKGEITFSDVGFAYPGCPAVFTKLSLQIHSGEKVGIVGRSGSGKSTFAHLLLRLYQTQSGSISIDGQDIQATNLGSVYDQMTLVPQETHLFERSFKDNILYANPSAEESDLQRVLRESCCQQFIQQFPNGMNTLIGENGIRLSGGQKQRLSIARAMLRHTKILILDESTSHLDSVTESKLQDHLWQFFGDKTVLVIAHRLATLRRMDRIIVLDGGQIAEQGSHQELLEKQGLYSMMWRTQEQTEDRGQE
ncbi:MAG: ABC transporter ATP-binding protein [Alphaproteobacteria bacterium]|nr:ABC transporter ATP-binding protein [Alphaproteobacteria bacterium]